MPDTPLFDFAAAPRRKPVPQPDSQSPVPAVRPLSVTELTRQIKELVDPAFQDVWVVGQLSNVKASRGHVYPKLKDGQSELPAVIWNSLVSKLRFQLEEGMEVVCRGKLEVYQPQGKYQLYISAIEPKGIGALELAFQQLREKLTQEGLFDHARKKPLPKVIRNVALITSISGAAVRDFLQVLSRRTNRINVIVVPVSVQGSGAAAEMAAALTSLNRWAAAKSIVRVDCIALIRGGGSKEDLWAFNEEILVRAVAASSVPVVCGVGHEIDISLCDGAADLRALTPSQAAELISTEDEEFRQRLMLIQRQLDNGIERKLQFYRDKLNAFSRHPFFQRPELLVETRRQMVDIQAERLERAMDKRLQTAKERLGKTAAALEALSPLAVLSRGYSLTKTAEGKLLRHIQEVHCGDTVITVLSDGQFESVVNKITQRNP